MQDLDTLILSWRIAPDPFNGPHENKSMTFYDALELCNEHGYHMATYRNTWDSFTLTIQDSEWLAGQLEAGKQFNLVLTKCRTSFFFSDSNS